MSLITTWSICICGTETQMGGAVMPGDTITLCGMVSVPASSLADDTDILFDIEWMSDH